MSGKRSASMLPVERPLRIFVNDIELVTLMATPENLEELAYGWLWSGSLIDAAQDVLELATDVDRSLIYARIRGDVPAAGPRIVSSGCGGGQYIGKLLEEIPTIAGDLRIDFAKLFALQTDFMRRAVLYERTGGVHGAALADSEQVLYVAEDIGRHNAVDKVMGWALINRIETKNKIILTTGRISSEMLAKTARAGLAVAVTRTAATDLAVQAAERGGITVVGYMRASHAVIYSHPERILGLIQGGGSNPGRS